VLWDHIEGTWQQILSLGLSTTDIYALLLHIMPSLPQPSVHSETNWEAENRSTVVDASLQLLRGVGDVPPLTPDQYQELLRSGRVRENGRVPVPIAGPRECAAAQNEQIVKLMRDEDTALDRIVAWLQRSGSGGVQVQSIVTYLSNI
jgi:hypothetical protein